MALSDTCSPCWGARTDLRPGRLRSVWAAATAAVVAVALWANGLPWWLRALLLCGVLAALARHYVRQPVAVVMRLWPDAITLDCRDGRRLHFERPFAPGFWPGCVRVGPVVLYRDQMEDALWRRLCLVLRH